MKKSRFLALTLVVAIMLMGAGYAYWSDSLQINATVTTGEMNVEFIDPNFDCTELSSVEYVVLSPVIRGPKSVQFTLDNLYPGAYFQTLTEMQNKGTIPVKFDNAVVSFSGDPGNVLKQNIFVNFDCMIFDENGVNIGYINPSVSDIQLTNLQTVLNETLDGVRLEPGEYITLQGESIDQLMTFNIGTDMDNTGENQNLTFTITVNWKQHNQ